jgi:hypothetical protein
MPPPVPSSINQRSQNGQHFRSPSSDSTASSLPHQQQQQQQIRAASPAIIHAPHSNPNTFNSRLQQVTSDDRTEVDIPNIASVATLSSEADMPPAPVRGRLGNNNNPQFQSEYEAMIHHQTTLQSSVDNYQTAGNPNSNRARTGEQPYLNVENNRMNQFEQHQQQSVNMRPPSQYSAQQPPGHPQMIDIPRQQSRSGAANNPYREPIEEYRCLRDIAPDERAFRIGILISQQESAFGTNMYQSIHNADAAEMTNFMSQGYNEDEAALMLFERKFGRTPPVPETVYQPRMASANGRPASSPTAVDNHSHNNVNRSPSVDQAPGAVRVPGISSSGNNSTARSPVRTMSNINTAASPYQQQLYQQQMMMQQQHQQQYQQQPVRASNNTPNSATRRQQPAHSPQMAMQYASPQQQQAMYGSPYGQRQTLSPSSSMQSMRRVPSMHNPQQPYYQQPSPTMGGGMGMNPNDFSDVHPTDLHTLLGMGFSQFQAVQALRLKNYNVQAAAEYLLEH